MCRGRLVQHAQYSTPTVDPATPSTAQNDDSTLAHLDPLQAEASWGPAPRRQAQVNLPQQPPWLEGSTTTSSQAAACQLRGPAHCQVRPGTHRTRSRARPLRRHTSTMTADDQHTPTYAHPNPLQVGAVSGSAPCRQAPGVTTAAASVAGGLHHYPRPSSRLPVARIRALSSTPRDLPCAVARAAQTQQTCTKTADDQIYAHLSPSRPTPGRDSRGLSAVLAGPR